MDRARAAIRERWPEELDRLREVLAGNPKLAAGAVEDALALYVYLAGRAPELDTALRDGDGPGIAIAHRAAAALASLPPHRGGTVATLTPTPAQWDHLRHNGILAERGFHSMLTAPRPAAEGAVDLLVWSMTARRTEPLDSTVDGRVVFPPGRHFKVLELAEGERPRILLRELSEPEIAADGTVAGNRRSLDQLATTSLLRFAERWRRPDASERPLPAGMFRLPGVPHE